MTDDTLMMVMVIGAVSTIGVIGTLLLLILIRPSGSLLIVLGSLLLLIGGLCSYTTGVHSTLIFLIGIGALLCVAGLFMLPRLGQRPLPGHPPKDDER